jgi:parallel beta-helix repeat protein
MNKNVFSVGITILLLMLTVVPFIESLEIKKPNIQISNGNILYVGGTGEGNFTIIQDAIDNASDDDTVFVYDDSSPYYENILINKSIKLVGEEKLTTCIDAKENGTVVEINADNVSVKDFSIQHSGREYNAGVNLFGNNCNISDNIIINNHYGIGIHSTNNTMIHGNKIKDNNRDGIQIYYTNNSTIQHNIISRIDSLTIGIHSVYCNNITICNNMVNKTYHGIYISATTNSTIDANCVTGCHFKAIMLANAPDNIIKNNSLRQYIHSNYACDITLDESPRCIVENNSLYSGLFIDDSYPNIILDNLVQEKPLVYLDNKSDLLINYSCGQIILFNCSNITIQNQNIQSTVLAIYLKNSVNCYLFNNTIFNNRQGITCSSSDFNNISNNIIEINRYRGLSIDSSNNNNIYNNDIENNGDYGIIISGLNNTIANNKINYNGYVGFDLNGQNISIINNTILRNNKGISVRFLSNSNIQRNTIKQNTEYGISISDSTNNTLAENVFIENEYGITLGRYCNKHTIINNDIRKNKNGLILDDAYDNEIIKNNFIDNEKDAFFQSYLCQAFFNKWFRNYWDHPRFIKIIWGTKTVIIFEHATKTYVLFRFDFFPSLKPYDIPI